MTDLATFLAARLGEDETAAKQALSLFIRFEAKPGDWTRLMCDPVIGPFGGSTATRDVAIGLYVGKMSDPARVLREVEADRAFLRLYEQNQGAEFPDFDGGYQTALEDVLKIRAARFSDHPDYDEEWKP